MSRLQPRAGEISVGSIHKNLDRGSPERYTNRENVRRDQRVGKSLKKHLHLAFGGEEAAEMQDQIHRPGKLEKMSEEHIFTNLIGKTNKKTKCRDPISEQNNSVRKHNQMPSLGLRRRKPRTPSRSLWKR